MPAVPLKFVKPHAAAFFESQAGSPQALAFTPAAFAKNAKAKDAKPPPKPQNQMSPAAALDRLMKGNARYVEGTTRRHNFKSEREALVGGQIRLPGVLSCADSRIAPEYAFDSSRGDLFVCRVAGNFANDDTVASLEYGVAVLNSPLILVLGHDSCGAVDATIKSLKDNTTLPGHLPSLVNALAPAVKASADKPGDKLANAIRQNVIDVVAGSIGDANPQRRRSRGQDQGCRWDLSSGQRQGRIGRLNVGADR